MPRRSPLLLASLLLAGPALAANPLPSLAEADASLNKGDLDDVYLAFGAVKPRQHPEGDKKVSALLEKGAKLSAAKEDWALAAGFASKSRQLDPKNLDAWVTEADAEIKVQHRAQAEEALDAAIALAPKNWGLVLRRAGLARDQGKLNQALELLRRIPSTAEEIAQARLLTSEIEAAQAQAKDATQPIKPATPPPDKGTFRIVPGFVPSNASVEKDETPAGYAARTSEHFRITYSEGQRDFAQKAGYEQQCLDLLEKAWVKVKQTLGQCTEKPTDVVLYTAQEFALHFGGQFGNGILGFYAGKIRMNRADTIDDSFFDTAVHEYTHAVIDSMSHGGHIPTWVHEGLARWVERTSAGKEPVATDEKQLLQMAQNQKKMPTLTQLASHSFADFSGPMITVAYEKSALAIDLISHSGSGLVGLERAIRASKQSGSFDSSFQSEFGHTRLAELDGEIARALE